MRWDELFGDLEAQLDAFDAAQTEAEVADRARRELALLRLVDWLRPLREARVGLMIQGAGQVRGVMRDMGPTWVLLDEVPGNEAVVPLAAVLAVSGLARVSAVPGEEGHVVRRLGLGHVLRGLARDRSPVAVTLVNGHRLTGTIDRVGADFIELADHAPGQVRRPGEVRGVLAIAHTALALIQRQ
jgi:hypothetical protein